MKFRHLLSTGLVAIALLALNGCAPFWGPDILPGQHGGGAGGPAGGGGGGR